MGTRTRVYRGIVASALLAVVLICSACTREPAKPTAQSSASPQEVVICSFGGSFQDAQRKAFFEPFERETGIHVREESYSGEYAKLKAMVDSGHVQWDVVDVEHAVLLRSAASNLFERLDDLNLPRKDILPSALHPFGVGANYYSTVVAFPESGAPAPKGWADFWDTRAFPGPRSLRRGPRGNLEIALLADGVALDKLYPLDVDRAFRKLDKIKGAVNTWWTTGQQPVQLLLSKDVVMASAWNGRIWAARQEKPKLGLTWDGGLLELEWWVIPRGAPHREAARRFIEFTTRPDRQRQLAELFNVGPTNQRAFDNMPAELAAALPTSPQNRARQTELNATWWSDQEEGLSRRWDAWISAK